MRKKVFKAKNKHKGFTLAEVLITLGIIGVVATLTIHSLLNNYKAKRLHSQFLKSYSTIQQVFKQMEADDVSLDPSSYTLNQTGSFFKLFKNYLNGITDCQRAFNGVLPCADVYSVNYKTLDQKSMVPRYFFDDGQIVLPDGTLLAFENSSSSDYLWVFVDLNGYNNQPNILGYDLFVFEFLDGELRTMGAKGTKYTDMDKYCNPNGSSSWINGIACAQKAKENPDYFRDLIKEFK